MFAKIAAKIAKHQALRADEYTAPTASQRSNNYDRIVHKVNQCQFLSRSEYQALATMLAKIRTALTRIDCPALRAIESRYFKLMIRAKCASKSVKLSLRSSVALRAQFCYDSFGFGYFKFQN